MDSRIVYNPACLGTIDSHFEPLDLLLLPLDHEPIGASKLLIDSISPYMLARHADHSAFYVGVHI
jgi:hypothetical protein